MPAELSLVRGGCVPAELNLVDTELNCVAAELRRVVSVGEEMPLEKPLGVAGLGYPMPQFSMAQAKSQATLAAMGLEKLPEKSDAICARDCFATADTGVLLTPADVGVLLLRVGDPPMVGVTAISTAALSGGTCTGVGFRAVLATFAALTDLITRGDGSLVGLPPRPPQF